MANIINRAEAWEQIHLAFNQVNFNSFDYDTVKQSLIDYLKLYHAEDFNDFIESSEFIALIETFSYIAELFAYRSDLNAHENILPTAQRKDSVLRWAKTLSYKPSRIVPARGFVKINAVKTTENIFDSSGNNLANTQIKWNDPINARWKDQFVLLLNRVLEQNFGSVAPRERVQVNDVLFELYQMNNDNAKHSIPFSASANGKSYPLELVAASIDKLGPYESRPEANKKFTVLYANDGLGDSSDTTGFLMFVKQGTLNSQTQTFDGVTPNQTWAIGGKNVNETDIWLNQIDPSSGEIVDDYSVATRRSGEWLNVPNINGQNVIFNGVAQDEKFEVETLSDSGARVIFGDGEFATVPNGTFQAWYRTSENTCFTIPRNSVSNKTTTFSYVDAQEQTQTLTVTYSLVQSLQNGSPAETLDRVRRLAPSVYYTQDRMVNGQDYNTFPLQDPSVLKMKAVNRTFSGDSKYIAWHDSREFYDNVKLFGNDLVVHYEDKIPEDGGIQVISAGVKPDRLILNHIQPLLSSASFFTFITSLGIAPRRVRRQFQTTEISAFLTLLELNPIPTVRLLFDPDTNGWTAETDDNPVDYTDVAGLGINSGFVAGPQHMVTITPTISAGEIAGWTIQYRLSRLLGHSDTTKFWHTNDGNKVLNYETLDTGYDKLVVLKNNRGENAQSLIGEELEFPVLARNTESTGSGLQDTSSLVLFPSDLSKEVAVNEVTTKKLLTTRYDFTINAEQNVVNITDAGTLRYHRDIYFLLSNIGTDHEHTLTIPYTTANNLFATPDTPVLIDCDLYGNAHTHVVSVAYNSTSQQIEATQIADGNHTPAHLTLFQIPKPFESDQLFKLTTGDITPHTHDITVPFAELNTLVWYNNIDPTGIAGGTVGQITTSTTTRTGLTLDSAQGGPSNHTHQVFLYFDPNKDQIIAEFTGDSVGSNILNHATRHDIKSSVNVGDPEQYAITLPFTYVVPVQQLATDPDDFFARNELTVTRIDRDATGTEVETPLLFGTDWDVIVDPAATDGILSNKINIISGTPGQRYYARIQNYVYFERDSIDDVYEFASVSDSVNDPVKINWYKEHYALVSNLIVGGPKFNRRRGQQDLAFSWLHSTPRLNLVDPTPSNIIDMFILPVAYYNDVRQYLADRINIEPTSPTTVALRTSYQYLLTNKMISDSVILHPGKIKLLFGDKSQTALQAKLKAIRSANATLTDNQIRLAIVDATKAFFNIDNWEFGQKFNLTELVASIHNALPNQIDTVVLVPISQQHRFGDLFIITPSEEEILQPDISVEDVEIVEQLNSTTIRQLA